MDRSSPHGPSTGSRPLYRLALAVLGVALLAGAAGAIAGRAAPPTEAIDATRERIRSLEAEVQRIDGAAAAAADAHAAAVRRAEELEIRIADATASLAEARRAHAVSVQRLADRVVALYRSDDPSLVEIVLSSGDLSDALDARRSLEQIGVNDRRIVDQLGRTRTRLAGLRASLTRDRAEARARVAEKAGRLAELRGLIGDRRAVLDEAQGVLDDLIVREERRRSAAVAARARAAAAAGEQRAERDLLRRADPADPPGPAPRPVSPAPADAPGPTDAAPSTSSGGVSEHLQRIALCESGGNPRAVSSSGLYRGKYQFAVATWQGLGGTGDPAAAPEAEQDRLAALLYARSGPAPWPVCGYR